MNDKKKLVVIGGGASGFFCAINAARLHPTIQVIVFEKSSKLLSKVKISGGGRCNTTHAFDEIEELSSAYPRGQRLLKRTLHQFSPHDTTAWFKERGVELKTEEDGRMFPVSNSSQTIIDCFLQEAERYGVAIQMNADVKKIEKKDFGFVLHVEQHGCLQSVSADWICIATGGYPKLSGFDWIRELGHAIVEPVPSLFTFNIPDKKLHALMGISASSVMVRVPVLAKEAEGPVLITHWGLSGPAVLKLSSCCARELAELAYRFDVTVNWVHPHHESSLLSFLKQHRESNGAVQLVKNPFGLVSRLWEYLVVKTGSTTDRTWSSLSNPELVQLSKRLTADRYEVNGKTTFKEEFVTAGGVDLKGIHPLTMESRSCPGLFFAGEVMDVDGITGGYNFQHAWSSGWIVANSIT